MSYSEKFKEAQRLAMQSPANEKSIPPDPYTDDNFGNWSSEIEATLDAVSLKNLYFSETWVYIVTNLVARKISGRPITINRQLLKNGTLTVVPSENHSLIDQLDHPNDYEGYSNFMYKAAAELTLMGNAIIWRLRFHKQLMVIPTEIVTIEQDKNGKVCWYVINFGMSSEYSDVFNGTVKIHPKDIIHVKLPHLNSMLWGLSPFVSGRKSVLFDKYTKEFLLNFYLKQANPGPVLELGELANEKQAMRLLKSIEMNWTGRRNQRRTMILPKGVSAKNLQQSMAEQQLKDHLLINRDDIRALLAVPPHEFGIQTTGSIGSQETKEQLKNFWEQTVIPFQNLIADEFTRFFIKELGPRTFFEFDNSDVGILQEDENSKADLAIKQLNVKTLNEVRAELYELKPVPGGDIIRGTQQALPQFPSNFSLPAPDREVEDEEEKEPLVEQEEENAEKPMKTDGFLRKNAEWWLGRKTKEDNQVDRAERKMLKTMLDIFADQAEIAVKEFKKIYKDRLKQEGFFPDEERLRSELNKAFSEFSEVYTEDGVPVLQATGEIGYDIHLNTPFNLPSGDEIQALRTRNSEGRKADMAARAISRFQGFNETTTNAILKRIEKGVEESATLQEIAKDILDYFGEVAPNRSKTIARTETLLAVSMGQKAAEEDATTLIPGMKKIWITAGDERVRDSHVALDGDIVPVDSSFKSGDGNSLEFPRDPRAPASDTIQCRCSWLMVPPEDADSLDFTGVF